MNSTEQLGRRKKPTKKLKVYRFLFSSTSSQFGKESSSASDLGSSSTTVELSKEFGQEIPLTSELVAENTFTSSPELKTKPNDPSLISELGMENHLTPELGSGNHLTPLDLPEKTKHTNHSLLELGAENVSKPTLEMENPNWQ